jgi:hypothetical protein
MRHSVSSDDVRRFTRNETALVYRLIDAILERGPEQFRAEYQDAGLDPNVAMRLDVIALASAVLQLAINIRYRRWRRRCAKDLAAIAAQVTSERLRELVDPNLAAALLRAAIFGGPSVAPEFTDRSASTYLIVAAVAVKHTTRWTPTHWTTRYRVIARKVRRSLVVDEAIRHSLLTGDS